VFVITFHDEYTKIKVAYLNLALKSSLAYIFFEISAGLDSNRELRTARAEN